MPSDLSKFRLFLCGIEMIPHRSPVDFHAPDAESSSLVGILHLRGYDRHPAHPVSL
jgi:hypothetical protein